MSSTEPEVHLRMLTPADASWMVALDQGGYGMLRPFGWNEEKLAAELAEGLWASEEKVGWAVLVDGDPHGIAFARELTSGDGVLDIRLAEHARGRGVGREVLRQLADHHFADNEKLRRLQGRTHEHNVPMQRAFAAAGFRMEARYRDTFEEPDGGLASEWGYALTRQDWEAELHRADGSGYSLHGLVFVLDEIEGETPMEPGALVKFLQEGRRVIATYEGGEVSEGELAGILHNDKITHRWLHHHGNHDSAQGGGGAHVQRRGDGRLEIIDDWSVDHGSEGRYVWVERR